MYQVLLMLNLSLGYPTPPFLLANGDECIGFAPRQWICMSVEDNFERCYLKGIRPYWHNGYASCYEYKTLKQLSE